MIHISFLRPYLSKGPLLTNSTSLPGRFAKDHIVGWKGEVLGGGRRGINKNESHQLPTFHPVQFDWNLFKLAVCTSLFFRAHGF
jgi:hypothetical protein